MNELLLIKNQQILSITVFKNAGFRELYSYRRTAREYWSIWAKQLGATIQLVPILTIPAVAIIQTCRYLNNGPPDIFDVRIQLNFNKLIIKLNNISYFPFSNVLIYIFYINFCLC